MSPVYTALVNTQGAISANSTVRRAAISRGHGSMWYGQTDPKMSAPWRRGTDDFGAGLSWPGITRVQVRRKLADNYFIEMTRAWRGTTASLTTPESIWRDAPMLISRVRGRERNDRPVRSVTSTQPGQTGRYPKPTIAVRSRDQKPTSHHPRPVPVPRCAGEILRLVERHRSQPIFLRCSARGLRDRLLRKAGLR